ncbi:hypothetical protein EYV94_18750 [Puteibacter caeruleilacunae]|nr:hypothetical protein EYV94_18750 [Puteibacter caeruleilacunae]
MKGSYPDSYVTFVLKDIGSLVKEQSTQEREMAIQNGTHYSEMLPIEYVPSQKYMDLYQASLEEDAAQVATLVGIVAEKAWQLKGRELTIVSLARAGTPIGVLVYRYLKYRYGIDVPHYSISIIRGKGIDKNALRYILKQHEDQSLLFFDGWTGKGAITRELKKALKEFNESHGTKIGDELAVLADPGYCAEISATYDDFLIPSACLNSTISGLVSRTFHRVDIIGPDDFHGARYYKDLKNDDRSLEFIKNIEDQFSNVEGVVKNYMKQAETRLLNQVTWEGLNSVLRISCEYGIEDVNMIKPGVGETTRVLLRRVPWKILIHPEKRHLLGHILQLAEEKEIEIVEYNNMSYSCCGLIKKVLK